MTGPDGQPPGRRRDQEFTEFVRARRDRLYRSAYLLCGDPHRAEDIVQQTLAKLYASWRRVQRADSVEAYARRAVMNAFIDEGRRRRREVLREVPERPAAERGLDVEEADELLRALRSLPEGQRRVVVLRHYWGMSVAETAADLGISPGTVKSQTADALTRLRGVLLPADASGGTP